MALDLQAEDPIKGSAQILRRLNQTNSPSLPSPSSGDLSLDDRVLEWVNFLKQGCIVTLEKPSRRNGYAAGGQQHLGIMFKKHHFCLGSPLLIDWRRGKRHKNL